MVYSLRLNRESKSKKHGRDDGELVDDNDPSNDDKWDSDTTPQIKKKRRTSKKKKKTGKQNKTAQSKKGQAPAEEIESNSVVLSMDVLGKVMEFVGAKELWALVETNQLMRGLLTPAMVAKSAMASVESTGSRRRMLHVHANLIDHAIFVPSPFRLLKILATDNCEFCCKASFEWEVFRAFSMQCCLECRDTCLKIKAYKLGWKTNQTFIRIRELLHNKRVRFIGRFPTVAYQPGGGEIRSLFMGDVVVDGERVGAMSRRWHIRDLLKNTQREGHWTQRYYSGTGVIWGRDKKATYIQIMKAVDEMIQREKRDEAIRIERRKQKALKVAQNRVRNLTAALDKLKPELHTSCRDFILDFQVDEKQSIKFTCPWIDNLLTAFVRAPTKVSAEYISDTASIVNATFKMLTNVDFLGAGYLSADNEFGMRLKPIFQSEFPDLPSLASALTDKVIELVEEGDPTKAMYSICVVDFSTAEFGRQILGTEHHDSDFVTLADGTELDIARLVGVHWKRAYSSVDMSDRTPEGVFDYARERLHRVVSQVKAYVAWAAAKDGSSAEFVAFVISDLYDEPTFIDILQGEFRRCWSVHNAKFLALQRREVENQEAG